MSIKCKLCNTIRVHVFIYITFPGELFRSSLQAFTIFLPILHKKCTKTEHEPLKWQVPQAHDAPQYEGVVTALVHEKNKLRYLHKAAFSHDDMYISPLKKCAVLNENGDKTTETKAFCVTGVIFHCMKEQLVRGSSL